MKNAVARIALLQVLAFSAAAQVSAPRLPSPQTALNIAVTDENGVAVPAARVSLQGPQSTLRCYSDIAGRCEFANLGEGPWQLRVEKETYYLVLQTAVQARGDVDVVLQHEQEVRETVNVVESPPAIDPEKVSSHEQLSGLDIINIPYPTTRDYRYVLNYIPGVLLDQSAQPHVAGGETYQTLTLLDDFNVTQPANGQLLARVSTDAIRSVDADTSRIPARYGKGPAGILALNTGIGDDHFRFAATNFIPSVQHKKGVGWIDGEYDNVVIVGLPSGENIDTLWRFSNLAKIQTNVTSQDIFTASFLVNRLHDEHQGISTLAPATTRPIDDENLYFASLKEQHAISAESLLEFGIGFSQYGLSQKPDGSAPYALTPEGSTGNYYLRAHTIARRTQGLVNYFTAKNWHGRHDLMAGIDADRLSYDQVFERTPLSSLREGQILTPGTTCLQTPSPCALYSVFINSPASTIYNTEASAYIQDRWSPATRVLIEPGMRFDWDEIVRRPVFSPRLAGAYVLNDSGNTKLSAGIGVTYGSTILSLIAEPLAGSRQDYFFDSSGIQTASTLTSFTADRARLLAPRFVNWSVALEQKLPADVFLKTEFLRRTGIHDFVYNTVPAANVNVFSLLNTREEPYYAFKIDLRRTFRKRYTLTGSYVRSSSRSNQVLDYSIDAGAFNPQVAGPFPWDAPNRFISWGWFPLVHGFDTGYSFEMRSGFPFASVNDQQHIVRPPGANHFPMYLTFNLHLEKRFRALGANWAIRGGFDNLTNRQNAYTVNNNVNSQQFLTLSNFDRRAFIARIRFLGRK